MIHVIDDFVIDSDGTQYLMGKLAKRINKKTGVDEEFIRTPSYYSSFSQAILGVSRRMRIEAIKDADGTLADALAVIRAADARLEEAVKVYDGGTT